MSEPYTRLLMAEPPLLVMPTLAVAIGLKEAIILQQLHYWLGNKDSSGRHTAHLHDGEYWVYNSYEKWHQTNFPFLSIATLRRKFDRLEHELHLIRSLQLSLSAGNGEKWYSIVYQAVNALVEDRGADRYVYHRKLTGDRKSYQNAKTCHQDKDDLTLRDAEREAAKERFSAYYDS